MSYQISYVLEGRRKPRDGDGVATGKGWLAFCRWIDSLDGPGEALARLVEDGEGWPLAELESQLEAALKRDGVPEDVAHVGQRLLKAIQDRPEGCVAVLVCQ